MNTPARGSLLGIEHLDKKQILGLLQLARRMHPQKARPLLRGAGYGVAVFYVFLTVVHTGILGAMVTFARVPLYPIYAAPAAAHGIDPLID